jgi:hypothetical protein
VRERRCTNVLWVILAIVLVLALISLLTPLDE